jgi:NADH dehydrogenase
VSDDPLLITGANGHLGQALLRTLAKANASTRAVVRSERAASQIRDALGADDVDVRILDYRDEAALCEAGEGCSSWVHLVGILKESANARYVDAHERTSQSLANAAAKAGARRLVSLSILGATPGSDNACLASKGRADEILIAGPIPATVLRLPMVLGAGEIAAAALRGKALAPFVFLTGGGRSLEQPIDTRDVIAAIRAAASDDGTESLALDLAGPEVLPHRELVERVAGVLGSEPPRVFPIPRALVGAFAALAERISDNPPLTSAMLGVLEHDDAIDPVPAAGRLRLELTSLEDTLRATFRQEKT